MSCTCGTNGQERKYRVLVDECEERSVLCRYKDKIKMDVKEIELEGGRWIRVAEDRDSWWAVVNTVMDCWVPYSTGIFFLCVFEELSALPE
jgi:hypothetical protein